MRSTSVIPDFADACVAVVIGPSDRLAVAEAFAGAGLVAAAVLAAAVPDGGADRAAVADPDGAGRHAVSVADADAVDAAPPDVAVERGAGNTVAAFAIQPSSSFGS